MPRISIITINYNNSTGLEKTINSVINQKYFDYEYLIIDGNSTDGSKEIIDKYSRFLFLGISENDNGIYNAMNKGIMKSNGDYLFFLNSGDYFFDEQSLSNLANEADEQDFIYGNTILKYEKDSEYLQKFRHKLTFSFFLKNNLSHQAMLIKKNTLLKGGMYNENNRIVSDWEFNIKMICLNNATYKYVDYTISYYEMGGLSDKEGSRNLLMREKENVLNNYFSSFTDDAYELFELQKKLFLYENKKGISFFIKIFFLRIYHFFTSYLKKIKF